MFTFVKERPNCCCLHGNVQSADVWRCFDRRLGLVAGDELRPFNLVCEDLLKSDARTIAEWSNGFCKRLRESSASNNYLIGYSLGGRLAFQAILEDPTLWSGVVIVAADPYWLTDDVREFVSKRDEQWARRFCGEPWNTVIEDWNKQDLFGGRASPQKTELSGQDVARLMIRFSNSNQEDQYTELKKLTLRLVPPPVLFVTGEKDSKYVEIGELLEREISFIRHVVIPDVYHRVPWESPEVFVEVVNGFFLDCEQRS